MLTDKQLDERQRKMKARLERKVKVRTTSGKKRPLSIAQKKYRQSDRGKAVRRAYLARRKAVAGQRRCACGCGSEIFRIGLDGKKRVYRMGHSRRLMAANGTRKRCRFCAKFKPISRMIKTGNRCKDCMYVMQRLMMHGLTMVDIRGVGALSLEVRGGLFRRLIKAEGERLFMVRLIRLVREKLDG